MKPSDACCVCFEVFSLFVVLGKTEDGVVVFVECLYVKLFFFSF